VAVLDLSAARPGSRIFALRPDEVRVPFGVDVSQVNPATLALDLERSAQRRVPVVPALEGDPAPGYVVAHVAAEPPTVDIVGPESRVRQIAEARTEPVNVSGMKARVRDVVNIGVVDSSVRLLEPENATVIVEITPAPVEKQFSDVPVRWRNLGKGLSAQLAPPVVHVTVRGGQQPLATLQSDAIQSFVDLAGLGAGRYNLRVQVDPAEGFGVTAIDPAVVSVTIR
jgi:YbbR domain-containing protein